MVLILNSFLMSSMPPDNLENLLDVGNAKNPLKTVQDVKKRLDMFLDIHKPKKSPSSESV